MATALRIVFLVGSCLSGGVFADTLISPPYADPSCDAFPNTVLNPETQTCFCKTGFTVQKSRIGCEKRAPKKVEPSSQSFAESAFVVHEAQKAIASIESQIAALSDQQQNQADVLERLNNTVRRLNVQETENLTASSNNAFLSNKRLKKEKQAFEKLMWLQEKRAADSAIEMQASLRALKQARKKDLEVAEQARLKAEAARKVWLSARQEAELKAENAIKAVKALEEKKSELATFKLETKSRQLAAKRQTEAFDEKQRKERQAFLIELNNQSQSSDLKLKEAIDALKQKQGEVTDLDTQAFDLDQALKSAQRDLLIKRNKLLALKMQRMDARAKEIEKLVKLKDKPTAGASSRIDFFGARAKQETKGTKGTLEIVTVPVNPQKEPVQTNESGLEIKPILEFETDCEAQNRAFKDGRCI